MTKTVPKKAIIIGAGISGATAANELKKLGVKNIVLLEKNNRVGGKLFTDPELKIDLGAMMLMHHFPIVDTMIKKGIKFEKILSYDASNFFYPAGNKKPWNYIQFGGRVAWQSFKLGKAVHAYRRARNQLQEKPPAGQEISFAEFARKNNLNEIVKFIKLIGPGMGYGDLLHNYAYRIINYLGYSTIPSLALGHGLLGRAVVSVHGGFQQVVEKMLQGFDVRTSVQVLKVDREINEKSISVTYKNNNRVETLEADLLVLAMSPLHWHKLNMNLTRVESQSAANLIFSRHPVAVCAIENFPPKHKFIPEALDFKGFGHIAAIFTRDNRKNPTGGRICTVHINLLPGNNYFSLDEKSEGRKILLDDLKKLGYGKVKILKTHIWEDYNARLPWRLGIKLEKAQGNLNTLYVGTYSPFSFETVAAAEEYTYHTIHNYIRKKTPSSLTKTAKHIKRSCRFLFTKRKKPIWE